MILNNAKSDVIVLGNIKKNVVSIDPNNIDFIINILSTNLYSYPVDSFIRETVSNAWDSHIEANNTETPVIIELGKDINGNYFCSVRDTGTGISPERFENIYRKIGSSTKRDSDEFIGGFGIGRFSALAVSDTVYITSCFEGIKYSYIMYKENNMLNIDLLSSAETVLPNGVEVRVMIEGSSISDFKRAITSQLSYFENIFFDVSSLTDTMPLITGSVEDFNNLSIKRYNNFYVNSLKSVSNISLLLGKVKYPLRIIGLSKTYPSYVENLPIALNFNIGELSITPNREEIIYNSDTIAKIEKKLDLALEEITDLCTDTVVDSDNITEYLQNINSKKFLVLLQHPSGDIKIEATHFKKYSYTYKGKFYDKKTFNEYYTFLLNYIKVDSDYKYNGSITKVKTSFSLETLIEHTEKSRFKICNMSTLSGVTKDYLRATLRNNTFFIRNDFNVVKRYRQAKDLFHKAYGGNRLDDATFLTVYKGVINLLFSLITKDNFVDNNSPTEDYLKERKEKRVRLRSETKKKGTGYSGDITIYQLSRSQKWGAGYKDFVEKPVSISLEGKINRRLFVYTTKQFHDSLYNLCNLINSSKKVTFCRINPVKEKFIKDNIHFINIKDFFKMKHKHLKDFVTVLYILDKVPKIKSYKYKSLFEGISEENNRNLNTIIDYVNRYNSRNYDSKFIESLYKFGVENNLYNLEMKAMFEKLYPILQKCAFLIDTGYSSSYFSKSEKYLITDYLLARRIMRPDLEAVKEAKSFINNYLKTKD